MISDYTDRVLIEKIRDNPKLGQLLRELMKMGYVVRIGKNRAIYVHKNGF
jgi:hypothetical protein